MNTTNEGEPTPEMVLQALDSDIRRRILRELYREEQDNLSPGDRGVSFSSLRESVGIDSRIFNYHLNQLRGVFLEERDGKYYPISGRRKPPKRLLSWSTITHEPRGPMDTDDQCPVCAAPMVARYQDQVLSYSCDDHSRLGGISAAIPYECARDRTLRELVELLPTFRQNRITQFRSRICHYCYGLIDFEPMIVDPTADGQPFVFLRDHDSKPEYVESTDKIESFCHFACECRSCGVSPWMAPYHLALGHPAGQAFLHDHGIDPLDDPMLYLGGADLVNGGQERSVVKSWSPIRFGTTLTVDGDTCAFTFDGEATIIDIDRE